MAKAAWSEKRRRAAAFRPRPGPTPQVGRLDVRWVSGFDRSCFLVSTPDLSVRHHEAYVALMNDLRAATGCTAAEILAHGSKVRTLLFFAEDQLARTGTLASLIGRQKHVYELPAVPPAF